MSFTTKVFVMAALMAAPAFSLPTLRLIDCKADGCGNANDVTVTVSDQVAGQDGDLANAGSLVFIGSVGDWTINIVSGTSKPVSGSAVAPNLYVSSNNTIGGTVASSELLLEFTDAGFTGTPGGLRLGTSSAGTPFNVFSSAKYSDGDVVGFGGSYADPTSVAEGGPYTGNFSNIKHGGVQFNSLSPNGYSLTSRARVLFSGGVRTGTFDLRLEAVPEPGFYGMMALGLSGLFAAVARRRNAVKE